MVAWVGLLGMDIVLTASRNALVAEDLTTAVTTLRIILTQTFIIRIQQPARPRTWVKQPAKESREN